MTSPPESRCLFADRALLPDGWAKSVRVEITAGRIGKLERGAREQRGDERVAALLPGMGNVHSHGFQRGMAGLTEYRGPEADNFWSWRELMYRFVARMTPDDLEAVTAMAYVEMLEAGFTRVGEFHYVHHDVTGAAFANPAEMMTRVASAASRAGIALTLLPVFYAHGNFAGAPPAEGQKRFVTGLDAFTRLYESARAIATGLPDGVAGVAPHSLRAVTAEELQVVTALAHDGPIHIHAAEQVREVDDCLAWSGARPVQWLLDHANLDARWCLVHATHMTAEEITGLARSGAVAGFCPVTEANLGDGIAPAAPYLAAGGTFGIGTDSNVAISVREELRQLEYSQRLRDRARNVLAAQGAQSTGGTLFSKAQRGGARALGQGANAPIGIVEDAPADFFSLAPQAAAQISRNDDVMLDSLIFAGHPAAPEGVWRAGRRWVTQGVHVARERISARFRTALERLLG